MDCSDSFNIQTFLSTNPPSDGLLCKLIHSFFNGIHFQWEDYQQRLDNSVERITKHLRRTRTFWENGITQAVTQKTVIRSSSKPENSAIEVDSIEGSPRDESTT